MKTYVRRFNDADMLPAPTLPVRRLACPDRATLLDNARAAGYAQGLKAGEARLARVAELEAKLAELQAERDRLQAKVQVASEAIEAALVHNRQQSSFLAAFWQPRARAALIMIKGTMRHG